MMEQSNLLLQVKAEEQEPTENGNVVSENIEDNIPSIFSRSLIRDTEWMLDRIESTCTVQAQQSEKLGESAFTFIVKTDPKRLEDFKALMASGIKEKKNKTQKNRFQSHYKKNLSKKIGDLFCQYLRNIKKIEAKRDLQDSISWKKLNEYLNGSRRLKHREEELQTEVVIDYFLEFVNNLDIISLKNSKIKDEITLELYQIVTTNLKEIVKSIMEVTKQSETAKKRIKSIEIVRIWPDMEIKVIYFDQEELEKKILQFFWAQLSLCIRQANINKYGPINAVRSYSMSTRG